ncbi:acyl-CoA dehydratase activase [Natranaerobius thermophilus]|uniref:CoA-substrate-specific enzyme activase n=1 Tax=Natranaerobius thermophilus (strain ATCC BAA-1301 / DSM 18059 / JW/NM-WN-LF) TaxID=457570 RepID=B2A3T4_NATTJ|nr:acyl-CoA dehydratase activase [Natranaerobius thermophilus]ACB83710.1 CoA-substrate-specific enzyme activase [Natranaerobius thermophilus JW/NM-WN-LF]
MKAIYLGVDVGSVSTNFVALDENYQVLASQYLRTKGEPIKAIQTGLRNIGEELGNDVEVKGVGSTGSARTLAGVILGADTVKNEITAHAVAASQQVPEVKTVLEIGGQDSKIIILREGVVVDFAMNTVCAAGTGSFLDHQSERLGVPIEEFGEKALMSDSPVRIAGRCSVFAESDMIHKQQMGHETIDIIRGLSEALVRNYLNNVGKGKEILSPIVFQGGVAANRGIKAAFEQELESEVVVPNFFNVMGAIGAAILAKDASKDKGETSFRGFQASDLRYQASSFECSSCPNMCEIVNIKSEEQLLARWGGRCEKWEVLETNVNT